MELLPSFLEGFSEYYEGTRERMRNVYGIEEEMGDLDPERFQKLASIVYITDSFVDGDIYTKAAYLGMHVAVSHILENGNKRTAMAIMFFCLSLSGIEVEIEANYFAEQLQTIVSEYGELQGRDKEEYLDKVISVMAKKLKQNAKQ